MIQFPNAVDITTEAVTPFHWISFSIFILAILHTLFARYFTRLAQSIQNRHAQKGETTPKSILAEICFFLGEVEVVFGLWVIPLLVAIVAMYNWDTARSYIDSREYVEPLFVVVVMCLTSTRPIVKLSEKLLSSLAGLLGGSVAAWWCILLSLGPLLGSFITEAAAMTLTALLLVQKFFEYKPSSRLAYATVGLLFVNVSVGGILTNFAAPPVLIVARSWDWNSLFMLKTFGWKAACGVAFSTTAYFMFFKKELLMLGKEHSSERKPERAIPLWITCAHVFFVVWVVIFEHDPPIFIGAFLLFLGMYEATSFHQYSLSLRRPILIGLFLAGLIIHGGVQGWWIVPLLRGMDEGMLMAGGALLTAFNDNAAVTYLSSLLPSLSTGMKEALMSGVVVGGGLTVIANAPNPAGYVILKKYFPKGISAVGLFVAALIPTLIMYAVFSL